MLRYGFRLLPFLFAMPLWVQAASTVTYCVGFDAAGAGTAVLSPCPPPFDTAKNAAGIATILAKMISSSDDGSLSNVTAKAKGDHKIEVTCSDTAGCAQAVLTKLTGKMSSTARRYTVLEATYGNAQKVADSIKAFYPGIDAEPVENGKFIELASAAAFPPEQLDDIRAMIRTSFAAVAVPLPLFCLSGTLDGERPHVAPAQRCGGQTPVPAGNAADIAKLLTNDTITVATETTAPNQLSIKCQTVCRQVDLDWIRESILELAWPSPAYVQDVEVPSGGRRSRGEGDKRWQQNPEINRGGHRSGQDPPEF
jgi:hypothetical protein